MIGIYPGAFDPITNGHLDIIERARNLFDELYVAIGENPQKKTTFDLSTRLVMIRESLCDKPDVKVMSFSGLLVDAAREVGAQAIVRGLRAITDYEMEVQMAIMNRTLDSSVDTVILVSDHHWSFISSSIIKEIHQFGGDISPFVPKPVLARFNEGVKQKKGAGI